MAVACCLAVFTIQSLDGAAIVGSEEKTSVRETLPEEHGHGEQRRTLVDMEYDLDVAGKRPVPPGLTKA